MGEFFRHTFSTDFLPHGFCFLWQTELVLLHAISDALIALSYYSIPFVLLVFVRRRRDLPFPHLFFLFAAFIFACGTTHALGVWTLWHGWYGVEGLVKGGTALVSMATAIALVPVVPRALALRSPSELEAINKELRQQIFQRERAQAALVESEERFRSAFENAGIGMALVALDGRFLQVNRTLSEISGYSAEQMLSLRYQDLTHPDDLAACAARLEELSQAKIHSFQDVSRYWHKRGHLIWVQLSSSVVLGASGEPLYLVFQVQDITQHKFNQDALFRVNSELRAVLSALPDLCLRIQRDGTILSREWGSGGSPELEDVFRKGETVHAHLASFVGAQFEWAVERVCSEREKVDALEFSIPRAGGEGHFEARLVSFLEDQVIVIVRDITQRKHAETALLRNLEQLARSNDELNRFAYIASHDLQEPLRAVASYTQLLARRYQGQLDPQADEFIRFAVDGAQRMSHLIADLLAYSRAGHEQAPLASVNCEDALDRALFNLHGAISATGAVVTHDPLPVLLARETEVVQLFQNLIGNAIKFRRPGAAPLIQVGAADLGDEWRFFVKDNGIGIEPQHFERIMMLFQRLHPERGYPGTGIGLAICTKVVERYGGRLWVESQPGEGSTFYFTIPKDRKASGNL